MILHSRTPAEHDAAIRQLALINLMRNRVGYNPPVVEDTPWIRTRWARKEYL